MSRESQTDLSASGHCMVSIHPEQKFKENDTTPQKKTNVSPVASMHGTQIYLLTSTIHLSQMYPNLQVNIRPKRMRCPEPRGNIQWEAKILLMEEILHR